LGNSSHSYSSAATQPQPQSHSHSPRAAGDAVDAGDDGGSWSVGGQDLGPKRMQPHYRGPRTKETN